MDNHTVQIEFVVEFMHERGYYNLSNKVKNGTLVKKKPSELYLQYRDYCKINWIDNCTAKIFHRILAKKNFFCLGEGKNAFYELWVDETAKL